MQSGSGNAEKIERYAAKAKIRTEKIHLISISAITTPNF